MKKGFTLIELIVVIAIIAILSIILIPQVVSYINDTKITTCNENMRIIEQEYTLKTVSGDSSTTLVNDIFTNYNYTKISDGIYQSIVSSNVNISASVMNSQLVTSCYLKTEGEKTASSVISAGKFTKAYGTLLANKYTGDNLNLAYYNNNEYAYESVDELDSKIINVVYSSVPTSLVWMADTNNSIKTGDDSTNYIMIATSTGKYQGYLIYYNKTYYKPSSIAYNKYTGKAEATSFAVNSNAFTTTDAVEEYIESKGWVKIEESNE